MSVSIHPINTAEIFPRVFSNTYFLINFIDISFQHNIIAEALNVAGHKNYPKGTRHGYAATIGGDISSYHHNLLAHNEGRNWSMSGELDGAGYYAGQLDLCLPF